MVYQVKFVSLMSLHEITYDILILQEFFKCCICYTMQHCLLNLQITPFKTNALELLFVLAVL